MGVCEVWKKVLAVEKFVAVSVDLILNWISVCWERKKAGEANTCSYKLHR